MFDAPKESVSEKRKDLHSDRTNLKPCRSTKQEVIWVGLKKLLHSRADDVSSSASNDSFSLPRARREHEEGEEEEDTQVNKVIIKIVSTSYVHNKAVHF